MILPTYNRRSANVIRHSDNIGQNEFNGVKLPLLKGHVKVTLHNCRTGKNEVVEGSNIVTNAVKDIFSHNYCGSLNFSSLLPIYNKWYGGVLCYSQPFAVAQGETDPDPDDYFIQGNDVNMLTAHAGPTAPSTAAIIQEDLKRGSPLEVITSVDEYGRPFLKQTWEWGSAQGNGTISALSLTHADTGDAGTGGTSSAFGSYSPWASIGNFSAISVGAGTPLNLIAQYDKYHGVYYAIGNPGEYQYGNVRFDTHNITVYIKRLAYESVGLYDMLTPNTDFVRTFTVTCEMTFKCMPSFYFDPVTKYLWLFHNVTGFNYDTVLWNKTTMNYVVIDCANEVLVDEGTIVSDASDLAPTCVSNQNIRDGHSSAHRFGGIVKEGNYVYLPTSSGTQSGGGWTYPPNVHMLGYKKININTQSDQTTISFVNECSMCKSTIKIGGLLVMSGRVTNAGIGYNCADQLTADWGYTTGVYAMQQINKVSMCVFPIGAGSSTSSMNRYIFANKLVNSTKYNLSSSVIKSAVKSMQVEYTLTELSPSE